MKQGLPQAIVLIYMIEEIGTTLIGKKNEKTKNSNVFSIAI